MTHVTHILRFLKYIKKKTFFSQSLENYLSPVTIKINYLIYNNIVVFNHYNYIKKKRECMTHSKSKKANVSQFKEDKIKYLKMILYYYFYYFIKFADTCNDDLRFHVSQKKNKH